MNERKKNGSIKKKRKENNFGEKEVGKRGIGSGGGFGDNWAEDQKSEEN